MISLEVVDKSKVELKCYETVTEDGKNDQVF